MLHSTLRNSVTSYFSDLLEINKNDISKTWKVLRFILGLDSNTNKQKNYFLIEDKLVTDNLDIANGFNNFFVSIGPKLANNLKRDIDPLSYVKGYSTQTYFFIIEILFTIYINICVPIVN